MRSEINLFHANNGFVFILFLSLSLPTSGSLLEKLKKKIHFPHGGWRVMATFYIKAKGCYVPQFGCKTET